MIMIMIMILVNILVNIVLYVQIDLLRNIITTPLSRTYSDMINQKPETSIMWVWSEELKDIMEDLCVHSRKETIIGLQKKTIQLDYQLVKNGIYIILLLEWMRKGRKINMMVCENQKYDKEDFTQKKIEYYLSVYIEKTGIQTGHCYLELLNSISS
jgi:hypothetical protein